MTKLFLIIAGIVAVGSLLYALYKEYSTRKMLDRIQDMLEEAIQGDYNEKEFSEAKISKLESKLADYLQSSSLSAANVR